MHLFAKQIILWFGSIAAIPDGWVLCDGNNGTPDLTDNFVVGAGNVYAPGEVGGTFSHLHPFTSDLHNHTLPAGTGTNAGANISTTTSSETVTGDTSLQENVPPYYALAYIMKT